MSCRDGSLMVAVLAGGEGSRIGGGKPLRMLAGRSLIARAVAAAGSWAADAIVVGRDPAQVGETGLPFIADAPGAEGPIAGLAAALRHARTAGHAFVLAIACDSPFLPADLPDRLREELTPEAGAALAVSGGVLHPACALWRTRTFEALGPYLATGRRALRGFAEHVGFVTATWPTEPVDPFFNLNSPDDLAEAERLLES